MRYFILTLVAAAAPASATQSKPDPQTAPFEFQGAALDAEFASLSSKINEADCVLDGDVKVCENSDAKLFESPASISYSFKNYDGGLRLFKIRVIVIRPFAVEPLRTGLEAKWGKPSRLTVTGSVWENKRFSLSFDNLSSGAVAHYENKEIVRSVDAAKATKAAAEL